MSANFKQLFKHISGVHCFLITDPAFFTNTNYWSTANFTVQIGETQT